MSPKYLEDSQEYKPQIENLHAQSSLAFLLVWPPNRHCPHTHFTEGNAAAKQDKQGHQAQEQRVTIWTQVCPSDSKALAPSFYSPPSPPIESIVWARHCSRCLGYNDGHIRAEALPEATCHPAYPQCSPAHTPQVGRLFPGRPHFQSPWGLREFVERYELNCCKCIFEVNPRG